jgi:hypothetical protein
MKRKKNKVKKIRNKTGEKTSIKEIQGIIRDYFENLYLNKLQNLEEIDKFLVIFDHPQLNHEDISYLNRSITSNKIEAAIVSPKITVQDLTDSPLNSTTPSKKT